MQDTLTEVLDTGLVLITQKQQIAGDTIVACDSLSADVKTFGDILDYNILNDNWVSGCVILSFIILVCTLAWTRNHLINQARNFFTPSNNLVDTAGVKTPSEIYAPIAMSIVLCFNSGLLIFAAINDEYSPNEFAYPQPLILGICIGSIATYHLLRWRIYKFVNWVFFKDSEKHTWDNGFYFLMTLESLLVCPAIVLMLNMGWNSRIILITFCIAYGLTRFFLLCHSFRIFFPKIYGLLHLFAYLCTLELIPLLILWKFLTFASEELIIK